MLVYIIMYFVITRAAVREVAFTMKASKCQERGALGFVTDSFLDSRIHWCLLSSGKDVALNVIAVAFASNGGHQLICSALVLGVYIMCLRQQKPYNSKPANALDFWGSTSLFLFLVITASFGSKNMATGKMDRIGSDEAIWLIALLLASIAGPAALSICEIMILFPKVHKYLPKSVRPVSESELKAQVEAVKNLTHNFEDIGHYLPEMDENERNKFCRSLFGGDAEKPLAIIHGSKAEDAEVNSLVPEKSCRVNCTFEKLLQRCVQSVTLKDESLDCVYYRADLASASKMEEEFKDQISKALGQPVHKTSVGVALFRSLGRRSAWATEASLTGREPLSLRSNASGYIDHHASFFDTVASITSKVGRPQAEVDVDRDHKACDSINEGVAGASEDPAGLRGRINSQMRDGRCNCPILVNL